MAVATGVSSGRLDMMGGVADYSGSLVLEVATTAETTVTATFSSTPGTVALSSDGFSDADVVLQLEPLLAGKGVELPAVRKFLQGADVPRWAFYVYGSLAVFVQRTGWVPAALRISVTSTVPHAQGVSSSASVECATLKALRSLSGIAVEDLQLAHWAQAAENHVVGAPCGLMDQLSSMLGTPARVLPILCRPDACETSVALPDGVVLVGWPSGVKHSVAESPYLVARTATFMGKRMAEAALGYKVAHVTELSPSAVLRDVLPGLPGTIAGAEFTTRYGGVDDPLSVVEPSRTYDVAAALRFPVEENFRCGVALSLLKAAAAAAAPAALLRQVGELMQQTHIGYTSIGLGSPETDEMVRKLAALKPEAGVYGARVSGGGSGGTVVVLCERSALPLLERIAAATTFGTPFTGLIQ